MEYNEYFSIIRGERVRELRKKENLSLKNLGDKVDMTRQGISRIENGEPGKTQVRKYNLSSLATALGCTEKYLTGESDDVRGTGKTVDKNGEKVELTNPLKKFDFVADLTKRLQELGPRNSELISLFFGIIEKAKPEEQQYLKEFLKMLPSFDRYKNVKKVSSAERTIARMHDDSFTKKSYEYIYRIISEEEVIKLKRMKLTKEEFIEQMQDKFGKKILQSIEQELENILKKTFGLIYQYDRVRKGPYSRSIKKESSQT